MEAYPSLVHAWSYPSSVDAILTLLADVYPSQGPAPLCLAMHGWHGDRASVADMAAILRQRFCVVAPDMRGRGGSTGQPDANGFELLDALDALTAARAAFPEWVSGEPPRLWGGSGGGGNAYALAAKAPDRFGRVAVACGISDYAHWYRHDQVGEFIDELDVWIGASPGDAPEAYAARSGLNLLNNLRAPLAIWHGADDPRVPVWHARNYAERARELGAAVTYHELPGVGHAIREPYQEQMLAFLAAPTSPPRLPREGTLWVGGWLWTEAFRVVLDQPGRLLRCRYRLDNEGWCEELILERTSAEKMIEGVTARVSIEDSARVVAPFPVERCSIR